MKTLLFFRHGKSDWEAGEGPDHDRGLAKRGQKSAKAMGNFVMLTGQVPDAAVTSSAVRARATLDIAMQAGGWTCPVRVKESLYEATAAAVIEEIRSEADTTEKLMVVGHEPAGSDVARLLIGGGAIGVPTGCMLRIDFDVASWKEVAEGGGKLLWLMPPRLFTDNHLKLKRDL